MWFSPGEFDADRGHRPVTVDAHMPAPVHVGLPISSVMLAHDPELRRLVAPRVAMVEGDPDLGGCVAPLEFIGGNIIVVRLEHVPVIDRRLGGVTPPPSEIRLRQGRRRCVEG
jgi:hypothetical protein